MRLKRRELKAKSSEDVLFSNREILYFSLAFIGFWIVISIIFNILGEIFKVGVATLYPVGKARILNPFVIEIIIAVSIFMGFLLLMKIYSNYEFNLVHIILLGIGLIICTSLINGIWKGLVSPTEGSGGMVFYWDAIEIEDALKFLINYEKRQEKLELHSRTHPPGAVLFYYLLYKIFYFSAMISIAICVISALFSAFFLNRILYREFNKEVSLYMSFLFLLLPAIQIYYLANLYAIVTSLILATIFYYNHPNKRISLIGTIFSLFLIAFLTFMVIFILGVLICFEILRFHNYRKINYFGKLYVIFLSLFVIYVAFLIFFDYNYINSLLFASREENPYGFSLLVNPYDYFITRVEDILEIAIFFGPFLIVLFVRGFPIMKKEHKELYLLTISSLIILLSLFLAGAYRTGETARACSYIYPFLIFPVSAYFFNNDFPQKEKIKLLTLIFIQTIIMQTIAYYKW